ncbi:MAG: hypothetical protein V1755_13060 [Chloroflexota bacterium]
MNDLTGIPYSPNRAINAYINQVLPLFSNKSQGRIRKAIHDAGKAALKHQDENTDAGRICGVRYCFVGIEVVD